MSAGYFHARARQAASVQLRGRRRAMGEVELARLANPDEEPPKEGQKHSH